MSLLSYQKTHPIKGLYDLLPVKKNSAIPQEVVHSRLNPDQMHLIVDHLDRVSAVATADLIWSNTNTPVVIAVPGDADKSDKIAVGRPRYYYLLIRSKQPTLERRFQAYTATGLEAGLALDTYRPGWMTRAEHYVKQGASFIVTQPIMDEGLLLMAFEFLMELGVAFWVGLQKPVIKDGSLQSFGRTPMGFGETNGEVTVQARDHDFKNLETVFVDWRVPTYHCRPATVR